MYNEDEDIFESLDDDYEPDTESDDSLEFEDAANVLAQGAEDNEAVASHANSGAAGRSAENPPLPSADRMHENIGDSSINASAASHSENAGRGRGSVRIAQSSLGQILSALTNGRLRIISPPPELNTSDNGRGARRRRAARRSETASSAPTIETVSDERAGSGEPESAQLSGVRVRLVDIDEAGDDEADRNRSGMVAYFVDGEDDDDDDEDDEDYQPVPLRAGRRTLSDPPLRLTSSSFGFSGKRRKDEPSSPLHISTDRIMSSDFRLQLDARFGRLGPMRHRSLRSASLTLQSAIPRLPSLLAERECRALTPSEKLRLSCQLLPDTKMRLAHLQSNKFFGGIYSDSGNLFASYSQDQYIRLFDTSQTTAQAHMIRSIRARDVGWSIIDVQIAPDGSNLVYSSWSDSIHMCSLRDIHYTALDAEYDAENREQNSTLRNSSIRRSPTTTRQRRRSTVVDSPVDRSSADRADVQEALQLEPDYSMSFCVFSMSYSYDAREIIAGSSAGSIYVYDLMRGRRTLCISGAHDDDCNAVAFSRSSSDVLFSAGDDGLIKIWDRRTLSEANPRPVGTFAGHRNGCTFLDPHFDGRHLLSNSKDQTMKLWDCRRTASSDAIKETHQAVKNQAWDYRWARNARQDSLREQATAKPLRNDCSLMTYAGAHTLLTTLIRARFSPQHVTGGRYVYCGSGDNDVVIYDALTAKPVKLLMHHTELVRDVHWHPYRQEIVSSGWDGDHELWFHRPSVQPAAANSNKKGPDHSVCVCNDADDTGEAVDDEEDERYRQLGDRDAMPITRLMMLRNTRNVNTAAQRQRDRREKVERLVGMGLLEQQ